MAQTNDHNKTTIRSFLDAYTTPEKVHYPKPIHLIVDALYFGKRTNFSSWGVIVFRDGLNHENLWWKFVDTETTWAYAQGKGALESLGYTILSATGDGFGGIRSAFFKIPFQMCLVHMERLILRGTTRNPKTEAGEVLLALARTLHTTDQSALQKRVAKYWKRYGSFLTQTTRHPDGSWSYTHKELRRAAYSLRSLFPYLFTYEKNKSIPKNTNSLEGHFSHIRDLMRVHRGASRKQQEKILNTILFNSSVAKNISKKG